MSLRASIAVLLCAAIHWSCTGASDNSQSTADGGAGEGGASGDGSSCDTADPCVDDTDCGPGTRCNHQSCTRLYCLSDGSPCENDVICESETCVLSPSDYVCWSGPVAEGWSCLASECQSGLSCVSGTCRGLGSIGLDEACTETDQCVSDLLCRPLSCGQSSSTCRELSNVDGSCCDASDCRTGLQCESGTCQSPATLTFLPESITFDFVQHQPGPPSQTIRITNEGGDHGGVLRRRYPGRRHHLGPGRLADVGRRGDDRLRPYSRRRARGSHLLPRHHRPTLAVEPAGLRHADRIANRHQHQWSGAGRLRVSLAATGTVPAVPRSIVMVRRYAGCFEPVFRLHGGSRFGSMRAPQQPGV